MTAISRGPSPATLFELRAKLGLLDGDDSRRIGAEMVLDFAAKVGLAEDCVEEGPATAMSDILANLRRLAGWLGLDYEALERRGEEYEAAEAEGSGLAYDPVAVLVKYFGDARSGPSQMGLALSCYELNALAGLLEAEGRHEAALQWQAAHLSVCQEPQRHVG